MANTPELQKEERRLQVRKLWLEQPSSNRTIAEVIRNLQKTFGNVSPTTIKRDIAYIRRQARRAKKHEKLDMREVEIYERLIFEHEKNEDHIVQAIAANNWAAAASFRKIKVDILDKITKLWGLANDNIVFDQSKHQHITINVSKYDREELQATRRSMAGI